MSENNDDIKIGFRIRLARRNMGYTQKEVGNLFGLTSQYIQKIEMGRTRIPARMLYKMSIFLKKDIAWFYADLGGSKEMSNEEVYYNIQTANYVAKIKSPKKRRKIFEVIRLLAEDA